LESADDLALGPPPPWFPPDAGSSRGQLLAGPFDNFTDLLEGRCRRGQNILERLQEFVICQAAATKAIRIEDRRRILWVEERADAPDLNGDGTEHRTDMEAAIAMSLRPVLLPLGTGAGATTVIYGDPSTSFAILLGEECRLLVDLGYGVVRQALRFLKVLPTKVYISHNHSDHSGDLPVAALRSATQGQPFTIWSAPEVERRLKEHRLHEFREAGASPENIATWIATPEKVETTIDNDFSIVPQRGRHSETCFGFILRFRGEAVLGYSADSGFSEELYRHLLAAPLLVLDGRLEGSTEHASFEELETFFRGFPDKKLFITHYGRPDEAPRTLNHLRLGESIEL
jgi:ribonuclease BN (tRNA processing enzyme)